MKSVRLDPEIERQLHQAARLLGVSESEIIRDAVSARCQEILGRRLDLSLSDYIGVMSLGGGRSDDTGRQFAALLEERERAEARR